MAQFGHDVTAAEPSSEMRSLARAVHPNAKIRWIDAELPKLQSLTAAPQTYDLIVLSAVWMHVDPNHRLAALERLSNLLAPSGEIYMTLRSGPADEERAMYLVTPEELALLAPRVGLTYRQLDERPDLLGRSDIRWKTVVLTRPPGSLKSPVVH